MIDTILHLGSNIGYKAINLELARVMIDNYIGAISAVSNIYQTSAWGHTAQEDFYNQAIICHTELSSEEVLERVKQIERKMGRAKREHWGPRIIDVDIIFFGDKIVKEEHLIIPHPQLTNRNFVLVPLLDICPQKIHPIVLKTIELLHQECQDEGTVNLIEMEEH